MGKKAVKLFGAVAVLVGFILFSPNQAVNAGEIGTVNPTETSAINGRSTSGYLYKNGKILSHKQSSRVYEKTVEKGTKTWVKGSISVPYNGATATIELGQEWSEKTRAKRYKVTGTVVSQFDKYDRYANKKIETVKYTTTRTWYEDVAY